MSVVDFIILLIVLTIVGSVIYFNFIKKKDSICTKCPYKRKDCECNNKSNN